MFVELFTSTSLVCHPIISFPSTCSLQYLNKFYSYLWLHYNWYRWWVTYHDNYHIVINSGVASLTLMPEHRFFTHNATTGLDTRPTFMKALKIMHIQYNLSWKCTCDNLHLARHYILLFTAAYFTTLAWITWPCSIVQLDDPLHNPPANKLASLKESSTAHCTSLLGGWSTRHSAHSCLFSGLSDYPEFNIPTWAVSPKRPPY